MCVRRGGGGIKVRSRKSVGGVDARRKKLRISGRGARTGTSRGILLERDYVQEEVVEEQEKVNCRCDANNRGLIPGLHGGGGKKKTGKFCVHSVGRWT